MTDHMDEALDLFKRVWNRKDLDAETQIEQVHQALQAAHERGKAEATERAAKRAWEFCMGKKMLWKFANNIAAAIRKDKP